ncbi:uncharacterized protein LOC143037451 [Oratosquilla oratoria]|uniref:uncharacterized protein LOC143037451 n=1 Tax=Oratosquilla oratoria TaxID=337810 RepID=UPI003F7614EA
MELDDNIMDNNVVDKRTELCDFEFQLQGLLSTLQKLPSGEQRAALNLLQTSVGKQLNFDNGINQAADTSQGTVIPGTGTENHNKSVAIVTSPNDVPGCASKDVEQSESDELTSHVEGTGNYTNLPCISSDGLSWPSDNGFSEPGLSRMYLGIKNESVFQSDIAEAVPFTNRIGTSASVIDIKNEMFEGCNSSDLLNSKLGRGNTKDSNSPTSDTNAVSIDSETIIHSDLVYHDSAHEVSNHVETAKNNSASPISVSKSSKTKISRKKKYDLPESTRPRRSVRASSAREELQTKEPKEKRTRRTSKKSRTTSHCLSNIEKDFPSKVVTEQNECIAESESLTAYLQEGTLNESQPLTDLNPSFHCIDKCSEIKCSDSHLESVFDSHDKDKSNLPQVGDVNNVCEVLAHNLHSSGGHTQEASAKASPEITAAYITTTCPTTTTTSSVSIKDIKKGPADSSTSPAQSRQCDSHLTCNICNAKFISRVTYKRHMDGHKRNDCSKCPERFSNHKSLKAHMKAEHNVDIFAKLYPCEFCQRTFIKRVSLYYHLKVHASQSQIVCQKCGKFCEDGNEFNNHMADHIKGTNFKCHLCAEIFVRRQQFDEHMKGHKKNVCEVCQKSFSNKRELIRHCRGEHQSLPQNISLDKEYKCEKCDHVFNRPSLLKHHLLLHNGIKPLECQLCNKQFSHRRGLRKHLNSFLHEHTLLTSNLKQEHAYDSRQNCPFICEFCGVKFKTRRMLYRHCHLSHKNTGYLKCPHCDYKTKTNNSLKRHVELHTESRQFICEMCGSSFHALGTLKDHHNFVHSDERNHVCATCSKSFKNKSSLRRHMRIHSDKRPYECHCGTGYKRLSHLKRHMAASHNEAMKSRAVKKIRVEGTQANMEAVPQNHKKLPETTTLPAYISEYSDAEEFEFVSAAPTSSTSHVPVTMTTTAVPTSKEDAVTAILPHSENIILMGDSSQPEQSHFITVNDPQIIHLIPSSLQFPHDTNLQTVSLVTTNDLQSLSVSSGTAYSNVSQNNQVFIEPFSLAQHADAMIMAPQTSTTTTHLTDADPLNTSLRIDSNSLVSTPAVTHTTNLNTRHKNISEVKQEVDLASLESGTDLGLASHLHSLGYDETNSTQNLLPSLPPAHYITHTIQSHPPELMHHGLNMF